MNEFSYKTKDDEFINAATIEYNNEEQLSPFAMFCEDFLSNFVPPIDSEQLNKCISNIMEYLLCLEIPIEAEFIQYNFAEILMQYLEIDETPAAITCISCCTAHDDSISEMFIQNHFLEKASQFLNHNQFVPQVLSSLSNMASIDSNRQAILSIIPYNQIFSIADSYETDEIIMVKLSKLIYNLSKDSNLPLNFISFLSSKLLPSHFEEVKITSLWSLHNILMRSHSLLYNKSNLLKLINDHNLGNIYENLLSDESNDKIQFLGCCLFEDMIRLTPEKYKGYDFNTLIPLLNSPNSSLRSTAVICYKELNVINADQVNVSDFIHIFIDLLSQVQYSIKNTISDLFIQIAMEFDIENIVVALNSGICGIISTFLDSENSLIHLKTVKLLTKFIEILKNTYNDHDYVSPIHNVAQRIEENDILHRIEEIEENHGQFQDSFENDQENFALIDEIRIFKNGLFEYVDKIHD